MMIPPKISFNGDKAACEPLIGFAKKILRDLKRSMSFQHLPTGKFIHHVDSGTVIEVGMSYGVSTIDIYVDPILAREKKGSGCYCDCGTSAGVITKVTMPDVTIPEGDTQSYIGSTWEAWEAKDTVDTTGLGGYLYFNHDHAMALDSEFCRDDMIPHAKELRPMDNYRWVAGDKCYGIVGDYQIASNSTFRHFELSEQDACNYIGNRNPSDTYGSFELDVMFTLSIVPLGAHSID